MSRPEYKPLKRAFEKYKPRGLFSEFYGSSLGGNGHPYLSTEISEQ